MPTFDPSGLRAEIARAGLSIREAAAKARVSESFLYRATGGKAPCGWSPKYGHLCRIAEAIGCDVSAFYSARSPVKSGYKPGAKDDVA